MHQIRIGHSPDPDDAFMFYGFASGQVTLPEYEIVHVLHDIQTLNEIAVGDDPLEVTAMSLHAYFDLENRYELLEVGTSAGRGYGPRLIARQPLTLDDLHGARIALPGPKTTATLAARALLPQFHEVHMDFTNIMAAIASGNVDAGIVIHEGQLTYGELGFHLVADLGRLFAERHQQLPLPLGVNCVLRDLAPDLKKQIAQAYRASVVVAMTQREQAVKYSLQFGRGITAEIADRFVGMYVNEDSLAFNSDLKSAVEVMRRYYAADQAKREKVKS